MFFLSCSLPFHARIRNWDRLDQCLRVWVFRMSENILHSSCFHQFPIMHHAYPVTQKPYHGKIVCNEQKRKTMLLLQMPEQVHDLCLNGIRLRMRSVHLRPAVPVPSLLHAQLQHAAFVRLRAPKDIFPDRNYPIQHTSAEMLPPLKVFLFSV